MFDFYKWMMSLVLYIYLLQILCLNVILIIFISIFGISIIAGYFQCIHFFLYPIFYILCQTFSMK